MTTDGSITAGADLATQEATDQKDVAMILHAASPALRAAAVALLRAQQGKIDQLRREIETTEQDNHNNEALADSLERQGVTHNKVRGLRARVKNGLRYNEQCHRAIKALESGFIPIPYLDFAPAEHWLVKRVPYRVLKAIEEGGLKQLFDELGIVEPQNETLRSYTFREDAGGGKVRETKVMGRVIGQEVYVHDKDPMLIGRLRVGKRDQWFLIGTWADWLSQLG